MQDSADDDEAADIARVKLTPLFLAMVPGVLWEHERKLVLDGEAVIK